MTPHAEKLLFAPLAYASASSPAETEEAPADVSVDDIAFLGRCLALQEDRADLSALRLQLFQSAEAWARLLSLAEATRLLAAVAETLQRRGLVPPEPRGAVEGAYSPVRVLRARLATHQARRTAQRERLIEIVTAFNKEGIEPVLIKGAQSLWSGVPGWRYQIDLDLLVEGAKADAAQAALLAIGYWPEPGAPVRNRRHHLQPLFRADHPGCVEIHRRAGNRYAEPLLPSAELLAASAPSKADEASARLLPPHLHVLQALIHHHIGHTLGVRGGIALKGLYEFAWTFTRLDASEREALARRAARNIRVAAALDFWIAAAADLFAMKVEEPVAVHDDAAARWRNVLARMGGELKKSWKYPGYAEEIAMACDARRLRRVNPSASFLGRQLMRLEVVGSLLPKPPN